VTLAPDDIATIYNIAPLYQQGINGAGQSIAVLGGSMINLDDIRAFRSQYNLTGADPQIVECCGSDPGETMDEAEMEADLDVEWSSAVARGANIIFVYARDPIDTVQYVVDNDLAPVVSESFGGCEATVESTGMSFDTGQSLAQTANAKGMTWLDASGDSGAADCDAGNSEASQGLAVEFPASMPEVTGVGGTELNEGTGDWWSGGNGPNLGSALSYIPETAWNDTQFEGQPAASGGGASASFSKPSWQTGSGVPADGMRDVPDVSLTASPDHDPYNIFTIDPSTGAHVQTTVGGTSVSAQVFAGIVALLNQSLAQAGKGTAGNINPQLYALARTPGIFHEITTGNNIVPCSNGTTNCASGSYGYTAGPGYDLVTGLGSVDAYRMVACWSRPSDHARPLVSSSRDDRLACHLTTATATALTANPSLIFTNGSINLTAAVSRTRSRDIPTGSVTFRAGSIALGTAALAGGVASLNADANLLPAGSDTITADYSGDTAYDASSGSATVTVNTLTPGVGFSANPNPIVSASGAGTTTLSWSAAGYAQLEITVGSVTGTALTGTVGASGSVSAGKSVTDWTQFFLVDLTSHNAIASVTVRVIPPTLTPVLTSISPPTSEVGSPGFKLQVMGSNFTTSSVVLWGGTKLPTQFQNGGLLLATVPASYLTQLETIQVQVDTNGQVSAPLPFSVGTTPYLVNSMMTESANNTGCQAPTPTTSFSSTDTSATLWFSVEGAAAGDIIKAQWYQIKAQWYQPNGQIYPTVYWGPLPSGGSWCSSYTLDITGFSAYKNTSGNWKVVVTWNGTQYFSLPFTIQPVPAGPYDGYWAGTTSQGLLLTMAVANNYITAYSFVENFGIYGDTTYTGPCQPIQISGDAFSESSCNGFSGSFESPTQASGAVIVGLGITWTATKQ
jgi:subtilase family serine protease